VALACVVQVPKQTGDELKGENQMSSLRRRLREETRDAHTSVDTLFGQHDIATREGLSITLQAHAIALRRTLAALPGRQTFTHARTLLVMLAAIESDLAALHVPATNTDQVQVKDGDIHPLGLIYVIAGSRLGARILLSDIQASRDPDVASATRYFACPESDEMWKQVSSQLKAWTGSAEEEKKIIASAQTAFLWFEAAHRSVQKASIPA
jgi:heme oxygenase